MTHPWIINGIHNPIQPNLVDMELQKLSSEVSRSGFIDVGVEVGGDVFFHRWQFVWKLAEKFCHVRVNTIRMSTNRGGKKKKNALFVNVRVSMRSRSEGILSPRCPIMIVRSGKRLQNKIREKSDFEKNQDPVDKGGKGALTQIHHLYIDFFKISKFHKFSITKSIDRKRNQQGLP